MATTPQAVSAKLRKDGFRTATAQDPEGIRVSKGGLPGRVAVLVDFPSLPSREARYIASLEDTFRRGWHRYEVEHEPGSDTFYVTRP